MFCLSLCSVFVFSQEKAQIGFQRKAIDLMRRMNLNNYIDYISKLKVLYFLLCLPFCIGCSNKQKMQQMKHTIASDTCSANSFLLLKESSFDFGNIKSKQNKLKHSFEVINSGTSPLVIYNVDVSCNCVTVKFSKEPIKANRNGFVDIYLNPQKQKGKISKKVFIRSNAINNIDVLYIKANIY